MASRLAALEQRHRDAGRRGDLLSRLGLVLLQFEQLQGKHVPMPTVADLWVKLIYHSGLHRTLSENLRRRL
jgi:hypothetical protein